MSVGDWLLDAVILLVLLAAYPVALLVRRRYLSRHGGTLELSHRVRPDLQGGRGWSFGIGRYTDERLEWFPIFSLRLRPARSWERAELEGTDQRDPDGDEQEFLGEQVVIAHETPQGEVELAMSPRAVLGYQSWLEAAPPGDHRRPA